MKGSHWEAVNMVHIDEIWSSKGLQRMLQTVVLKLVNTRRNQRHLPAERTGSNIHKSNAQQMTLVSIDIWWPQTPTYWYMQYRIVHLSTDSMPSCCYYLRHIIARREIWTSICRRCWKWRVSGLGAIAAVQPLQVAATIHTRKWESINNMLSSHWSHFNALMCLVITNARGGIDNKMHTAYTL